MILTFTPPGATVQEGREPFASVRNPRIVLDELLGTNNLKSSLVLGFETLQESADRPIRIVS
jgi:hypothetical protein